ncbi:hypothetical protein H257_08859 [Aphanomyces astaci]|uniref:Tc1-like transposase DDE domain-containing protein n=1 Tax=Aphanomyces astaci TaxID=112090 RepID=W4GCN1_APHAT|nr:hypothetical protein H257_08859 [Aphanomyces astaci]ETV77442.1 hypothetical protein H257_08859 [Aphanomyces astaci]|eukprot:XP_009833229.1 hypothetical protein H257_08859 [Aphanomyces astaci]
MKSTVSEATARRWMVHAGYKFGSWKKDVYVDDHERQEVVEFRKVLCSTWVSLSERMASFSGEAMDILESPNDVSQEQVVWVTHDESIFYANDDGGMVWTNTSHPDLPKKGRGRSIMVSDFLCPCHGRLFMLGDSEALFVTEKLHVGKAQEGYWTSEHVIKQVTQRVLPAFAALYPGCTALFTFDQSTNHAAYATDALRTSSMNLNPASILTSLCSILEETIVAAGHVCLFFPKYHCELNPIESYWGAAKRHTRSNCDYSWNGLVQCVPRSLETYSYGLDYNMSKYAHKQTRATDASHKE